MRRIILYDNRFGDNGKVFPDLNPNQIELLKRYGNKSLEELKSSSCGVIDLSHSHLDSNDRKQLKFFECHEKDGDCRLDTGNLMGALRFRDSETGEAIQVEVLSRFDDDENSENKNYFLNYLLSKAFDVSIANDTVTANQPSLLNLLLDLLFVRRLGEAMNNGLLRQYKTFRNNDWNFRGRLDLQRHIKENVPLMNGIAYVKREIDYDVPVNQLLLLASHIVKKRNPQLFEQNENARDAYRELSMNVSMPNDVHKILSHKDCKEPIVHPYYREIWEPLRRLARMILEEERWQLFQGNSEEEVFGVVFDGSWLWEEYIATVLAPAGFIHCVKGLSSNNNGSLLVFKSGARNFYPDFMHKGSDGRYCVLDTKYKRARVNGVREDLHQVLCYLLLSGAKLGGLIFPPLQKEDRGDIGEDIVDSENGGWMAQKEIASPYSTNENKIYWRCFAWKPIGINDRVNFELFQRYMEENEKELRRWRQSFEPLN